MAKPQATMPAMPATMPTPAALPPLPAAAFKGAAPSAPTAKAKPAKHKGPVRMKHKVHEKPPRDTSDKESKAEDRGEDKKRDRGAY